MLVLKRFTSHIGPLLTLTFGLEVNYFIESDAARPAGSSSKLASALQPMDQTSIWCHDEVVSYLQWQYFKPGSLADAGPLHQPGQLLGAAVKLHWMLLPDCSVIRDSWKRVAKSCRTSR